ncbi:SLC13 family permease [Legionella sp. W05-934-2]|uniref:SLC13 family permease n=1 Tax=Legionella sp. W05-934-2 TaxID=1198649 RepID=UPI003461A2C0
MLDIVLLFAVLAATLLMFIWGYYRYDLVAIMSLMALVMFGIIPSQQAFTGFGNTAVITVACVMVITAAISQTGLVEQIQKLLMPFASTPSIHIGIICIIGAAMSAFMNNVGALALLMPIAIQSAIHAKLSPSSILMPLSFATVLGGMTTRVGTPPNLLISSYRQQVTGSQFSLFDYTPVGLSVLVVCLTFIILVGWRYIPKRRKAEKSTEDLYQIHNYISEVSIPEDSPVVGMSRTQLEHLIEGDFSILGLIRKRKKRLAIPYHEELLANDVLIVEASHEDLSELIIKGKLKLVHGEIVKPENLRGEEINTTEAVVTQGSRLEGRSWQKLRIRSTQQLNLLAIARAGKSIMNRLNHVNFNAGDVLLIQGEEDGLREKVVNLGLVPLAERRIEVGFNRSTIIPVLFFIIGIFLATMQWLAVSASFTLVVIMIVIFNVMPIRRVYQSIDWSIIVLLGALIPLGDALKSTGAAELIGRNIIFLAGPDSTMFILALVLIITMTLSDLMNNAATAVVMAPIAINIAQTLHMSVDPFLMAVAIGSSCSFLTPISHQNNTLIMGPGSYKFFDYLWLGVPVEILVLITSLPALHYFWL